MIFHIHRKRMLSECRDIWRHALCTSWWWILDKCILVLDSYTFWVLLLLHHYRNSDSWSGHVNVHASQVPSESSWSIQYIEHPGEFSNASLAQKVRQRKFYKCNKFCKHCLKNLLSSRRASLCHFQYWVLEVGLAMMVDFWTGSSFRFEQCHCHFLKRTRGAEFGCFISEDYCLH